MTLGRVVKACVHVCMYVWDVYSKVKQRLFILVEHLLFTLWGYYVIVWLPDADKGDGPSHAESSSWLRRSVLCWLPPILPSNAFHLFYLAKVS